MEVRTLYLCVVVLAAVVLGGCQHQGKPWNGDETGLEADSIGVIIEDSVADVRYAIAYPVSGRSMLVDSVRLFIDHVIGDSLSGTVLDEGKLHRVAEAKYAELRKEREEMQTEVEFEIPLFEYDCNITKDLDKDSFVVYSAGIYEYHGGAHGGFYYSCMSFRKSDGRMMGWNMLKNTDSKEFKELMIDGLCEYLDATPENLEDMLLIEGGISQLPLPVCHPCPVETGLSFCYQQYEVAPYAAGLPDFTIPYEKLLPFLTDEAITMLQLQ